MSGAEHGTQTPQFAYSAYYCVHECMLSPCVHVHVHVACGKWHVHVHVYVHVTSVGILGQ